MVPLRSWQESRESGRCSPSNRPPSSGPGTHAPVPAEAQSDPPKTRAVSGGESVVAQGVGRCQDQIPSATRSFDFSNESEGHPKVRKTEHREQARATWRLVTRADYPRKGGEPVRYHCKPEHD